MLYQRGFLRLRRWSPRSSRLAFVLALFALSVVVSCRDTSVPTAATLPAGSTKHPGNLSAVCHVGNGPDSCFCNSNPTEPECMQPPADSDSLSLVCTDSLGQSGTTIHRGDGIVCTASALAGIRRIRSWKFVSFDSSLKTNRQETDPDSTHFSNVWAGQMVVSGTVAVQAKVGSDTTVRSATAHVIVLPRDWVDAANPPVPGWPAVPLYVH